MLNRDLQRIRELIEQQRADGDGKYSRELRERVLAWIVRRRKQGVWWTEIACEVGLPRRTLRRWEVRKSPAKTAEASVALVPIDVVTKVDHEVAAVAIVSPSGFRIEGMSLADAIEALRRLG